MTPSHFPLSRRALNVALGAAFCLAGGLAPALAATPKDTLVEAFAFDDIITMDPAESFEISAGEIMGNSYDRLIRFDVSDPSGAFSVDASGCVIPAGHSVSHPNVPLGTTVAFRE